MYKINKFEKASKRMYIIKKIISTFIYMIIIPAIIFNMTLFVKTTINPTEIPDFLGLKSFVIISASMEPTIMTGDAIFVKEVEKSEIKKRDIISFHEDDDVITHRITNITKNNGVTEYTTKGDNNRNEDKQKVIYDNIEGVYQFKINGFGKIVEIIKNKITLVVLLVILVLISISQVIMSKKKLKRKEKRYNYNLSLVSK